MMKTTGAMRVEQPTTISNKKRPEHAKDSPVYIKQHIKEENE